MRKISAALASAMLLASTSAQADGSDRHALRTFYIQDKTGECATSVGPLVAAMTLACDASRAPCRASETPGGSDRRLVLDCSQSDRWSLEAFDASGMGQWKVFLMGTTEDRIRTGAMTAVRFETGQESQAEPPPSSSILGETEPRAEPTRALPKTSSGGGVAKGLVYGGFGVATVGTVAFVALLIDFNRRKNDLQERCSSSVCPASAIEDIDATKRTGTLANVALGVAVLGAATGIVGLVIWPRSPAKTIGLSGVRVTPVVGLGSFGLRSDF
jgi:hypothetical protein